MERYRYYNGGMKVDNAEGPYVLYTDAQATVEALQRERDEWERKCRELCQAHGVLLIEHYDVKKALDAERGKVENLEHKIQARGGLALIDDARAKAGLYDQLETHLEQLQALVRAAVERWRAQTNVKEGISFRMAMKALEATLNATTPAPETSIIGKCVPPSQYDQNAQVRGDIS